MPVHFAEHLEVLREYGCPIPLQKAASSVEHGRPRRRGVVVTFDDGYADNLFNAKPLLEHHEIPATVFVVSGQVDLRREFWWDELEKLLLRPGTLPETLQLSVNSTIWNWELGGAGHYGDDEYRRHRGWNVLEKDDPTPRQGAYRSLCELLRPLPEEGRRRILEELRSWAGVKAAMRTTHRALTPDEVSSLADGGLVEVGAHTVSHPVLSELPVSAQREEIVGSKAHLEDILGRPVKSFSYPFGARSDYTAETVRIVREAGFACACGNSPGSAVRGTDRFQLPRVLVRDWDGEEFARRLNEWFHG